MLGPQAISSGQSLQNGYFDVFAAQSLFSMGGSVGSVRVDVMS